jgi:hypothetical protein
MSIHFRNKIMISASTGFVFIAISVIISFSITNTEAQNMTNQTGGQQPTTGAERIISTICAQEASKNVTDSSSQAIVETRCLLREARNAVSADASDQAIQLINAAESKLSAVLGGNNKTSVSS